MTKLQFGKMRLPENMLCPKRNSLKSEIYALEKLGKLHDVYIFFCKQIEALGLEVSPNEDFFFESVKANENTVWLLLRRDLDRVGVPLSDGAKRHVISKGMAKMVKDAAVEARKVGETVRVKIV